MSYLKISVACACAILLSSCASLSQQISQHVTAPKMTYQSLAIGHITNDSIQLLPTFTVFNSNQFPLPINSVSYQLSLNNQQLVAGNANNVGTLAANGSKDVTLSLDLGKQSLGSLQQLLFKHGQVDYAIDGTVNVMGLTIPFHQQSTLFMPKVSFKQMKVVNGNFSQVDLMLEVEIDNKNDFNLPLDNLSYKITSGSTSLFSGSLRQQTISNGRQLIQLPLSFKPNLMFSNVLGLLRQPTLPLTIKITSPLFSSTHQTSLNLANIL
ncbi:MAG: LEA type 2 family protein [Gammaproteobacteria bacterium]|nr:LEA type 2 family protein [Gammaproteobacteria bacterium]